VRFEVVLPPTAPLTPVSPRRAIQIASIWLAALAVGAVLAYALTLIKPIVSSVRTVNEITNYPILGQVSAAFPTRETQELRGSLLKFGAASACLLVAFITALLLNWAGVRIALHALQAVNKT
jgi:hypothetical protein